MDPLEQKIAELLADIASFKGKAQEDIANTGTIATETKTALDTLRTQVREMQSQLDGLDSKLQHRHTPGGGDGVKSITDQIIESVEWQEGKARDWQGNRPISRPIVLKSALFRPFGEQKAVTEGAAPASTALVSPRRLIGVTGIAQQALRIRDVMNVVKVDGNSFDYVYQTTRTNAASPQYAESSPKAESTYAWQTAVGAIRTIAHYVKVSRQALDDLPWLRNVLDSELVYGLKVKEEAEILSGDGTGAHLYGIIPQATAFDTALLVAAAGWTRIDILRLARMQSRLLGLATYAPNAFVLNPKDLAYIDITKDSQGRYVVGDPKAETGIDSIWRLPIVESDSIAATKFLVGPFDTGATLVDRMSATVDISYEDDNNFTTNMVTIRCEERIGLAVTNKTPFITGTFTTSP